MRIVVYNILFGMKGNTPFSMALSNLAMHGLRPALPFGLLPQWIRKMTVPRRSRHLTDALGLIRKHSPDILCLNEALPDLHGEALERELRGMGFTTVVYGISKHHSPPFRIGLVLATKGRAEQIPFDMAMAPFPGGAGGAASVYLPAENLAILGVHLALPGTMLNQELVEVNAWIEHQGSLGRRMLVLGDFNLDADALRTKMPALLQLSGTPSPTCPSFDSIFKTPECVDHIFRDQSFSQVSGGTEQGLSDHKLVWSELT